MALQLVEAQGVLQIPDALLDWLLPESDVLRNEARASEPHFHELADRWHRETMFSSATDEITSHPAYRRVIAMGMPAVPWILYDLRTNGGDWFAALNAITGASPVADADIGFPRRMKEAWLAWGRANGYEA